MPVVFRFNGIRFHFFSNEGDPREPLHIHAQRAECLAKIWLHPGIAVADQGNRMNLIQDRGVERGRSRMLRR